MEKRYKVTNNDYRSILADGKYCLRYTIGSIVRSVPGTFGIMLYEHYHQARDKLDSLKRIVKGRILEVEPIGDRFVPRKVCGNFEQSSLEKFYDERRKGRTPRQLMSAPTGTVCYSSVKVLRDITHLY